MNETLRKLLSLNLALLLVILSICPVFADTPLSYRVTVNGTTFMSDDTRSGAGWSYQDGELILTDYNGSGIYASGDLAIYTKGSCKILGASGTYASSGISVAGRLILSIQDGTASITGGSARTGDGGAGINANTAIVFTYGGTAVVTGGNTTSGTYAGDGIIGANVYVYGPYGTGTRLTATGGNASTTSSGKVAGCGIFGGNVILEGDYVLCGGNGYDPGPAIFYTDSCTLDLGNMQLNSGKNGSNRYAAAIQGGSSATAYTCSHHVTRTETATGMTLAINRYKLALRGKGGTLSGSSATFTSLIDYYPASYSLTDYLFEREGYVQVAWTSASGDLVALTEQITPSGNTYLDATWEEAGAGTILLNCLGGRFTDDTIWKVYRNPDAGTDLPDIIRLGGTSTSLVTWRSEMSVKPASSGIQPGSWYLAGETIRADRSGPIVLYPTPRIAGSFIILHPAGGTLAAGGDVAVQYDYSASSTDLQMYLADGEEIFSAPSGCRFAGWSTESDGPVVYASGAGVTVTRGTPLHLYAVWEQIRTRYRSTACDVVVDEQMESVQVQVEQEWLETLDDPAVVLSAIYDEEGRMLDCALETIPPGEDSILMTLDYEEEAPPELQLIAVDAAFCPAGGSEDLCFSEMPVVNDP